MTAFVRISPVGPVCPVRDRRETSASRRNHDDDDDDCGRVSPVRAGSPRWAAPRRARYPDALVAFAVEHARAVRSAGRSVNAAAAELGLSGVTLSTWLSRSVGTPRPRLREIVVQADDVVVKGGERTVEVKTASGHIVRGLSVADAAALLRALS